MGLWISLYFLTIQDTLVIPSLLPAPNLDAALFPTYSASFHRNGTRNQDQGLAVLVVMRMWWLLESLRWENKKIFVTLINMLYSHICPGIWIFLYMSTCVYIKYKDPGVLDQMQILMSCSSHSNRYTVTLHCYFMYLYMHACMCFGIFLDSLTLWSRLTQKSLGSPGWLQSCGSPPPSVSCGLGLQAWAPCPVSLLLWFFSCFIHIFISFIYLFMEEDVHAKVRG